MTPSQTTPRLSKVVFMLILKMSSEERGSAIVNRPMLRERACVLQICLALDRH
jgi:hypothetical protein